MKGNVLVHRGKDTFSVTDGTFLAFYVCMRVITACCTA